MSFKRDNRLETIIYLALWSTLFIAPVMSLYIRTHADSNLEFDWSEVLMIWRQYATFFVIFLIHNHLLAPMLVYRKRRAAYFSIVGMLVVGFTLYQCASQPERRHRMPHQEMAHQHRPDAFGDDELPPPPHRELPPGKMGREPVDDFPMGAPPAFFGQHELMALVMLVLMLGANLGIKLYFKQRRDEKRMVEMEKQNLQQQLEYLKYQINPHFLMNTLNNIHALVDIDPEQSKQTIVELSKMMRFVLYEGNKATVPLYHELDFLDNYIRLMRLRYTDKVSISLDRPGELPNCEVPPLMFITFVENAFKHGVSYQKDSFIDISIRPRQNHLTFTCRNSKKPKEEDKHGGVGLKNVKQRLELIYGKNYTLNIDDRTDEYNIELTIPL